MSIRNCIFQWICSWNTIPIVHNQNKTIVILLHFKFSLSLLVCSKYTLTLMSLQNILLSFIISGKSKDNNIIVMTCLLTTYRQGRRNVLLILLNTLRIIILSFISVWIPRNDDNTNGNRKLKCLPYRIMRLLCQFVCRT